MKKDDYSNQLQIEALLNECKGNLFEYLVTQGLARKFKKEGEFLLSLPKDFRNRLHFYESTIRNYDLNLLSSLPKLAEAAVCAISEYHLFTDKDLTFNVIGKMVATNDNSTWNETDIVGIEKLVNGETRKHFVSLKLTKDHSFTNTKSAGIKSFIDKYFSSFGELAKELQTELNTEVDNSFNMMGHSLYKMIDQEFFGQFDSRWSNYHTELPGELSEEMRVPLFLNYQRVANKVLEVVHRLYLENPLQFYNALNGLCGFGNREMIQVSCFHQNYQLKEISIVGFEDLFTGNPDEIQISSEILGNSSIEIHFLAFVLQLRVKPMNKFTTKAYKINCSIKKRTK